MGRLDVDAMLSEVTEKEFAEWRAYFKLEPWGYSMHEELAAQQTMNSMRGSADESQLYPFTHHDLEYFRENMSEAQAAEMERRQMRQAYAAAKMQQIREQVEKEQREKANG
jgi:hypothetical protein